MDIISSKALELVPYLHNPNFKDIFSEMTAGENNNTQFLLRMELKRLCAPSLRIMDFRNDGDTEIFEFKGITHFLQKEDIIDFNTLLEYYSGIYTNGLYEELMRSHIERKKSKQIEKANGIMDFNKPSRFSIEKIKFASYAHRRDERMFFCSPIIITFADGRTLEAKTSDLSCSGIKILLPFFIPFTGREKITITFVGLIEFNKKAASILSNVPYETLGVETRDTRAWLKTRCLNEEKDFESFILSFQSANKYRYRIDIDYLAYTLNIKALEYQYLPKIVGIPLFFSKDTPTKLIYALKSDYNHEMLDYWRDERSDDKISSIFTNERMTELFSKPDGKQYTYIYSFKHTSQNHVFFLSATIEELRKTDLIKTFMQMAKGRSSFRVFKFEITKLNIDKLMIKNLISDTEAERADELKENLSEIGYLGVLTRIDTSYDKVIYEHFTPNHSPNMLQVFTHNTDAVKSVKLEYLQYITPRKEPRYIYKTSVSVYSDNIQPTVGWTRDISTKGLQIELSTPVRCYNGDVVLVSLPKFQELKKNISLQNIEYEIVYINSAHTILHLKLHGRENTHPVAKFLEDLIAANIRNMEVAQNSPHMSDRSKALRSITVSNLFSTPIIFMKGKTNRLGYIGESSNGNTVKKLMNIYKSQDGLDNTYPLFSNSVLKINILTQLQELKMTINQKQINVFIKRNIDDNAKISYIPQTEDSFESEEDMFSFIKSGFKNGYFGVFAIFLTGASKPDVKELTQELNYIKKCATHKFKALENNIWNVLGIADVIDITESILIKYEIPVTVIQQIPDSNIE